MSNQIQKVTVVPHEGRFAIQDEYGEFFYNTRNEVRTFAVASDANYFLRGVCEEYPSLGYIVSLPSGRTKYIGQAQPPEEKGKYGPHEWEKANLVTISDSTGMYDLHKCIHCGIKEKSYGLHGHLRQSGICKKNIITGDAA